jgi:hypothetical protein
MGVQQIRMNIHDLANDIEDEALLNACFEAMKGIAQAYSKLPVRANGKKSKRNSTSKTLAAKKPAMKKESADERPLPHDFSFVVLANEVLKGSEPLPETGEIAFERAFRKSLKTEPTLPNRL